MTNSRRLLILSLALIGIGLIGLLVVGATVPAVRSREGSPEARGQWIFRTGTDWDTGLPIPASGGMMMHMSCADCHGLDGRGLRTPMFVSPDIRYRNLTDPAGMVEPDGSRGHTYTDELIKRAITQGIDAEGRPLAWPMPRWQMTEQQLNDLLSYLKVLP
jgi:cytochrome c oxidase subunit 2